MAKKKKRVSKKVIAKSKAMKFDAVKLGLTAGILCAFCMAIVTVAGIFGYYQGHNSLMLEMYGTFGYSISWLGVLLGAIYGFLDGFVMGWLFAWIYNKLL